MKFSERYGYSQAKQIQREVMDNDIRNQLWNLLRCQYSNELENLVVSIWINFYKKPIDETPKRKSHPIYDEYKLDEFFIKQILLENKWFENLDLLQFISKNLEYNNSEFRNGCNKIFKNECFAYRFVNEQIVEITSEIEIQEIEKASNIQISEMQKHLNTALDHLSRRDKPDYRNSIKESISAVECMCRKMTGKKTLGEALKEIRKTNIIEFNESFNSGLDKIYGWTNGPEGIRHALMDKLAVEQEDARFMLVLCSAFINYLTEKINKESTHD